MLSVLKREKHLIKPGYSYRVHFVCLVLHVNYQSRGRERVLRYVKLVTGRCQGLFFFYLSSGPFLWDQRVGSNILAGLFVGLVKSMHTRDARRIKKGSNMNYLKLLGFLMQLKGTFFRFHFVGLVWVQFYFNLHLPITNIPSTSPL